MGQTGSDTGRGSAAAGSEHLRERREYARVSGHLSVALRAGGDPRAPMVPGVLSSLSLGGARVRCPVQLEQGSVVVVDMPIPSMLDPCSAAARIVAHVPCDEPGQHELCLEFTEVAPADLRKIADFVSSRLERERDSQQALQTRLELLQDLTQVFHATTDVGRITMAVVDIALEFTGAESGALLLLEGGGQRLRTRAAQGPQAEAAAGIVLRLGQGAAGWVAESRATLKLDRADEDETWAREAADQVGAVAHTLVAVPLKIKEHCVGVLEVMNGPDRLPFTSASIRLLEALASQAAIIIENARLCAQLEEAARESRVGLLNATAQAEFWHRAAESGGESAAVVYLLEGPRLLIGEAARRLVDNLGPLGEPLLARLRETLEDIALIAHAATRTSATQLLAPEDGADPVLLAHVSFLSNELGERHALLAQLVDVRT